MGAAGSKNVWEWFQLAVWDVKGFFGNKDAKTHAESLRAVNSQATPVDREIYQTVTAGRVKFGGIAGAVQGLFKSAGKGLTGLIDTLSFILRFFPLVLILGLAAYLIFYMKIFQKVGVKK